MYLYLNISVLCYFLPHYFYLTAVVTSYFQNEENERKTTFDEFIKLLKMKAFWFVSPSRGTRVQLGPLTTLQMCELTFSIKTLVVSFKYLFKLSNISQKAKIREKNDLKFFPLPSIT